ncbi:DoxX family protein [Virgibacillus alimentarius]|uniref:Membrane protein YphA (DoxX/SURF4 family) n=1 Tax=Virgibacillus alimentarius TaxID=698769 RepID=A0ABS4S7S7_9BACI|nr:MULTISPECIES: DoxX family protein [Virgibacillus]MBP2257469.1 putative membrane protein YphA (DoxX/SURF4 family) [Virgibacillus alimentarius]HLR68748.1 DoxX family protein [Virgibacillus sp.]
MSKWVYYAIGYVFITSGLLKLLVSDFEVMFVGLGLPFPSITLLLVAIVEITGGTLILGRRYMKIASIALMTIMLGAIYVTKVPILLTEGFLSFAFEARLDIVMLLLLIPILRYREVNA